eukprot:scaffold24586_cov111-Isochrysis_galbana.AAC.5
MAWATRDAHAIALVMRAAARPCTPPPRTVRRAAPATPPQSRCRCPCPCSAGAASWAPPDRRTPSPAGQGAHPPPPATATPRCPRPAAAAASRPGTWPSCRRRPQCPPSRTAAVARRTSGTCLERTRAPHANSGRGGSSCRPRSFRWPMAPCRNDVRCSTCPARQTAPFAHRSAPSRCGSSARTAAQTAPGSF